MREREFLSIYLNFPGQHVSRWNNQKFPNVPGLSGACGDGHKDSNDKRVLQWILLMRHLEIP